MVKAITKYVDSVSGMEFDTLKQAEKQEKRSNTIKKVFAFYKAPNDTGCRFGNGEFCIQRDKEFADRLRIALFGLIKKYYRWVVEGYVKDPKCKGFRLEHVTSGYLGRCLSDGDSDLYEWWGILSQICPECYREYGQQYYTNKCLHDGSIETRTMRELK